MNKRLALFLFALSVIVALYAGLFIGTVRADPDVLYVDNDYGPSTPGWGVDHFNRIQDAVDAATAGDTVYVYSGTYHEPIEVTETDNLTFMAEKGGKPVKSVIIDAGQQHGFEIWQSVGVKISGFKITNANVGIYTYMADYSSFTNNYIENCWQYGIYIIGNYSTIASNYITNTSGIHCALGSYEMIGNVFSKNTIIDSDVWGIALWDGVNCSITNNFISEASVGIDVAYLKVCYGNVIMNNEISNARFGGIKFEEPVYPGTPPMTDNIIGHNYIHDVTPYPGYLGYGINIEYSGGGAAENTQIHHNTIENSDIGIRNYGNYGVVHHNEAINCATDYIDLGTGNIDFKNSWNP